MRTHYQYHFVLFWSLCYSLCKCCKSKENEKRWYCIVKAWLLQHNINAFVVQYQCFRIAMSLIFVLSYFYAVLRFYEGLWGLSIDSAKPQNQKPIMPKYACRCIPARRSCTCRILRWRSRLWRAASGRWCLPWACGRWTSGVCVKIRGRGGSLPGSSCS